MLQAACHDLTGLTDDAIAVLREARRCRAALSNDEVTRTHGRRIAARLAAVWDRAA